MSLSFANAIPESVEVYFKRLGGLFTKTVTLTRDDLNKQYIPIDDIDVTLACPSISYKITSDSSSENALISFTIGSGGYVYCNYVRETSFATYKTGKTVSMKKYTSAV